MRATLLVTALVAVLTSASAVRAETWDYANGGTQNAARYSFTATAGGLLKAYFMPSTGYYHSALGAKVSGVTIGSGALMMGTTDNFTPFTFGTVSAGDSIEFFIDTYDVNAGNVYMGRYFSTVSHNADGLQHAWAAPHFDQWYLGPEGVPEGTFIGFEDTTTGDTRGDLNYRDYTFVVPNITVNAHPILAPGQSGSDSSEIAAVPEPASWAMMIGGFGMIGGALRRRRSAQPAY
jgi:hypothetical protein